MSFSSADYPADRFIIDARGHELDLRPGAPPHGAHVMGILNTTPDSFSDGGQFVTVEAAVSRAAEMLAEGASIIDIGGESTRPGAEPVDKEEEIDRVVPVIDAISQRFPEAVLSIDTYKPDVAQSALEAGAHIVNDVTGLRHHPETADVAADVGAPLILMHSVGAPGKLTKRPDYDDLDQNVFGTLRSAIETAQSAGVDHIVTDPGFGFGKSVSENLHLINHIDDLLRLGFPVLAGISRKSALGKLLGSEDEPVGTDERLFGALGTTAIALLRGATIIRTHDVQPTLEMLHAMHATLQS
ncbi:dihydropteroate synthase [Longibacter salinarum]|uniref:Dihydropteroate synthase n=1 Tax=Longibacter salinarum TaxID=1850348 RepID=A0A2A8CZ25_9BACT|nr:dihydropteroate synthase [Longibacter salinarum]PEN13880.1 dihydropteroate synthase [Longibacter salinarum]